MAPTPSPPPALAHQHRRNRRSRLRRRLLRPSTRSRRKRFYGAITFPVMMGWSAGCACTRARCRRTPCLSYTVSILTTLLLLCGTCLPLALVLLFSNFGQIVTRMHGLRT